MSPAAPSPGPTDRFAFGRFVLQASTRQLLVDGAPAKLGARAFDLLLALAERRERMVSKNELLDLVWPGLVVEEANLTVQVSSLRKLLGPTAIATIPGRGYRFMAPLLAGEEAGASPAAVRMTRAESPAAPRWTPTAPAAPSEPPFTIAPGLAPPTATPESPMPGAAAGTAPGVARGNVPRRLPPLVGRDDDLRALLAQIETQALVTITGAAGMGKTALAHAAAHALRERWRDGAWFVDLAPVTSAEQLVPAVAQTLGVTLPASGTALEARDHLVGVLSSMSALLVLDNCEQVVDAAGALAQAIVSSAPGVRLLATSQELLRVPREVRFRLDPLAIPAPGADRPGPDAALQFGAVGLFVRRAMADDPRFALSSENVQAVTDICRHLDGLPLAIELAAARVRLLGVRGLQQRLGERFRLLTGGARSAPQRHQTLHAAIDWSHSLLSAVEQTVLRRLGVFVGGFSLELAQALAQDSQLDEWAVLDAIGALVDKSMVVADAGERPRYRLLETTRSYALEKLAAAGEEVAWAKRHAEVVCEFFGRTEEARGGEQGTLSYAEFLQRLTPELDNARAALAWAGGDAGDPHLAIALIGASSAVFAALGLSLEARRSVLGLHAHVDDTVHPQRAALFWLGVCALGKSGQLPQDLTLDAAHRCQRLYRVAGARRRLYQALLKTAWYLSFVGESQAASALLPELLSLEDAMPAWLRAERWHVQGFIATGLERFGDALEACRQQRALLLHEPGEGHGLIRAEADLIHGLNMLHRYDEAIALAQTVIAREQGEHSGSMAVVLLRLMTAQIESHRVEEAWDTCRRALPGWRRDGTMPLVCGWLAVLAARSGRHADAVRLGAAASGYQRRARIENWPSIRLARERLRESLAAQALPAEETERLQREGEALDEAAIAALCAA